MRIKKPNSSTKNKTQKTPYEVAAARVATILADETTPQFLHDVLSDVVCDLSNETNADNHHPEVLPTLLEIGLREAAEQGLRQHNGSLSREEVRHAAQN